MIFKNKIEILKSKPKNDSCFDCKSANITHASINNSVFLCYQCAEKHLKLGKIISYVISLQDYDNWNQVKFSYLEKGGNNRLSTLLSSKFNIDKNILSISELYKSNILSYYRKLIKSEVNNEPPPNEIEFDTALNVCQTVDNLENFRNESQILTQIANKGEDKLNQAKVAIEDLGTLLVDVTLKNGEYGKNMIGKTGMNAINMLIEVLEASAWFFKGLLSKKKKREEDIPIRKQEVNEKKEKIIFDNSDMFLSDIEEDKSKNILSLDNSSISGITNPKKHFLEKIKERKNVEMLNENENEVLTNVNPAIVNNLIGSEKENEKFRDNNQNEEDKVFDNEEKKIFPKEEIIDTNKITEMKDFERNKNDNINNEKLSKNDEKSNVTDEQDNMVISPRLND